LATTDASKSEDVPAAVSGSVGDRDLLGSDENGDGIRDDLARYVHSLSEDSGVERVLLYLAKTRTEAMMADPQDPAAVKLALDGVFGAKGCLSREIDELPYQLILMSRLESALFNNGMRNQAMRRVMEADRDNSRRPPDDGSYGCPLPPNPDDVASYVARFPGVSVEGEPVNYVVRYAKPRAVALSENDTDLRGSDQDRDGVRDDLSAYIRAASPEPKVVRALLNKARADTAALLANPDDPQSVRAALRGQQEAWVCLNRDFPYGKQRSKLTRRLGLHLLNTEQRAIAMRKLNLAISSLPQEAEAASRRVLCLLPEVVARQ
jgi:hypothetical protein